MAKNNTKNINDFSKIAEFLRCLTYGCYHKTQLSNKKLIEDKELLKGAGIAEGTYANYLDRISFSLHDKSMLASHQQGRRAINRFVANRSAKNELANAYLSHSFLVNDAYYYIQILQILGASNRPLKYGDILGQFTRIRSDNPLRWQNDDDDDKPKDIERMLQRKIDDLVSLGVINRKTAHYTLTPSPFAELTAAERDELTRAICAHRELALLSVPGYQLICREPENIPLQLVNHSSARIIEDYNVYKLARAITERRAIRFSTEGKEQIALPHKIRIDTILGRNYLIATDLLRKSGTIPYRLERINNLTLLDDTAMAEIKGTITSILAPKPRAHKAAPPLVLQARYVTRAELDSLTTELLDRFPAATLRDAGLDTLEAAIVTDDALALVPYLRTMSPPVRIVSPAHSSIQERLDKDVKEALRNYGEI